MNATCKRPTETYPNFLLGRESILRARNGMTAFAGTPSLPEASAVSALSALCCPTRSVL
jgi:hypothetical protein